MCQQSEYLGGSDSNMLRETLLIQNETQDAMREVISISKIAFPMILTGLLLYCRSMISMLFLGRLGELALAGGSLALGFANITGYSVLSGLAVGMEPICGQAFGAKKFTLLGLCLQRTILLLLFTSIPITLLWLHVKQILLLCNQDEDIATQAQSFLVYSIPDLIAQSFLHPLRIYLRTQSITLPLTLCAAFSILLHIPINYLLVSHLNLGIKGVALSGVWTNFNLVASLILYIVFSGTHNKTWGGFTFECFTQWRNLLNLAIPSCISVCLEWWWYEIMILLCGLLVNPRATVASMGILIQTTSLLYIFPSSLSFSVSTRVGNKLGEQQPSKAKLSAIVGLICSIMLGLTALVFSVMVRNIWATMFTEDQEIIALTSMVLPIIGLCELGNCPQTTGCGVLRGTARPKVGAHINLGCFYLVGMPVAIWLAFFASFDFQGLWLGLLAAQASCALTMLLVLYATDWEFQAQRAEKLTATDAVLLHDDPENKLPNQDSLLS
ncbi:protein DETOXIFICATION 49-like isoform X3 [Arachis ipaensis]|uniref:protein DETOXIFICATION 49-like isoform X2 n=1 Tax=Arachis ipaensis TaxID=130454 RepID=UPI000A2B48E0|nr:protein DETOXIFICATION 49-like isoform X2 [Arachis ipaensis]XP_020966929.1 protein DETOXIFICATION 49-like isoform X3 [Arachis ipaensis]